MAKTTPRYPKKLRLKLERLAEKREARQAQEMTQEQVMEQAAATLWREFLPNESVMLMAARFDEKHHRLSVIHHLEPPHLPSRIVNPPPWEKHIETPSSTAR
jgi:hypothetical protein